MRAARTASRSRGRFHLVGRQHLGYHVSHCDRYFLSSDRNLHVGAESVPVADRCTRCKGWPEAAS